MKGARIADAVVNLGLLCRHFGLLAGVLTTTLYSACVHLDDTRQNVDKIALQWGLSRSLVQGAGFRHVVFRHEGISRDGTQHVYLEGDGSPWLDRYTIAQDPTPVNPIALRLMAQDPGPAIYLGRPCYWGLAGDTECDPIVWTHRRYSEEVVVSMLTALEHVLSGEVGNKLVFIGHSGGGSLAMLLAPRVSATVGVITLAGNLDIDAWTTHHDYSPLTGSLNPLNIELDRRVLQFHYVGTKDKRVPPALTHGFEVRHPQARVIELIGDDHTCCWTDRMPLILQTLQKALNGL